MLRILGMTRPTGRRLLASALVTAGLLGGAVAPAAAQDTRALMERIDRLERDLQVLQRQVYRGDVPSSPAPGVGGGGADVSGDVAARLQNRITELEQLVTRLTGRVEETQYQVQQLDSRLQRFIDDVDFRLRELESTGTAPGAAAGAAADEGAAQAPNGQQTATTTPAPGANSAAGNGGLAPSDGTLGTIPQGARPQAPTPAPELPGGAALPEGTPDEQYKYAFNLLRQADYPKAAAAFQAFVQQHPQHELAGNAQYWLGETHYVRNDFDRAAVTFLEGYRGYPKSAKAPDNLLKLGLSMANLDKTREACAAFGRIGSEYPDASDAIKRRAQQEAQALNCGGQ